MFCVQFCSCSSSCCLVLLLLLRLSCVDADGGAHVLNGQMSAIVWTSFPPLHGTVQPVTFDEDVLDAKLAVRVKVWFVFVHAQVGNFAHAPVVTLVAADAVPNVGE